MANPSGLTRWRTALKPASWPKLAVPTLLGQALGIATAGGKVHSGAVLFGFVFLIFDAAFIVLLNDWADQRVDAIKRSQFPHAGSPKTIFDGILEPPQLLRAGLAAGLAALLVSLAFGVSFQRPALLLGGPLALLLFVAYSLPPLRLNYRGGGELLEACGVGLVLPWINTYAQSGELFPKQLGALGGYLALSLASAIASGLSDEESDRVGGKRTVVTLLGNGVARRLAELGVLSGAALWLGMILLFDLRVAFWVGAAAAAVTLQYFVKVLRSSSTAVTGAFAAQGAYKLHLHHAIWRGGTVLALGVLVQAWFG